MRNQTQGKDSRPTSLFARLLSVWDEYRRVLLVLIIALALFIFISSLSTVTQRSLLNGLLEQRSLILLLLFFSLLTLSLLWSVGQRLDIWVFLLFNLRGYHPLWLDRIMWGVTQVGNGLIGLLLGVILYFLGLRRFAVEMLLGILSLWLAIELIKAIVERSRPFLVLEGTRVIGWRERGKSFPSGHTAQAFFMMTLAAHQLQNHSILSAMMYGTATLVAFTRIYVGAHYPRDVIGGAILGGVWGILTGLVQSYLSTGQF